MKREREQENYKTIWQDVLNCCIKIKVYRGFCVLPTTSRKIVTCIFLKFYSEKISNIWGIH